MQQYEKDKFYSLLFFTELLCSGHTSESSRVYEYAKDTLNLAFEIIEYAVQNNKYTLYHEIINAAKNLDLSHKQTILSRNLKEIICNLYKRFEVNVGNLLEENIVFAYEYNNFLVVSTCTEKAKKSKKKSK